MEANWLNDRDETEGEITLEEVSAEGVHYEQLSTDPDTFQGALDVLKKDNGYVEQDEIGLSPATPGLEAICAKFIGEHHHDDDEVRFVLDGEGVFDIRTGDDRWMRVKVEKGDLVVVPAKRHHRFMLTELKTIRCVRLFKDPSGWVPHYRHAS